MIRGGSSVGLWLVLNLSQWFCMMVLMVLCWMSSFMVILMGGGFVSLFPVGGGLSFLSKNLTCLCKFVMWGG